MESLCDATRCINTVAFFSTDTFLRHPVSFLLPALLLLGWLSSASSSSVHLIFRGLDPYNDSDLLLEKSQNDVKAYEAEAGTSFSILCLSNAFETAWNSTAEAFRHEVRMLFLFRHQLDEIRHPLLERRRFHPRVPLRLRKLLLYLLHKRQREERLRLCIFGQSLLFFFA